MITVITGGSVYFFAPLGNERKILQKEEIVVYKRIARILFICEAFVLGVAFYFSFEQLSKCLLTVFLLLSIILMAGKSEQLAVSSKKHSE